MTNTYRLVRRSNGDYQLILIDAHGIEHPQETIIEDDNTAEVEGSHDHP